MYTAVAGGPGGVYDPCLLRRGEVRDFFLTLSSSIVLHMQHTADGKCSYVAYVSLGDGRRSAPSLSISTACPHP